MEGEIYDIAMHPALVPAFKEWLHGRGLHLAGPVKSEIGPDDVGTDMSFYIIGINNDRFNEITDAQRLAAQDDARGERDR